MLYNVIKLVLISSFGGTKLVKSMPSTADLYSSIVGKRPSMVDSTTSGVDPNSDSPFFSAVSATTRPWNRRVEVAITVKKQDSHK